MAETDNALRMSGCEHMWITPGSVCGKCGAVPPFLSDDTLSRIQAIGDGFTEEEKDAFIAAMEDMDTPAGVAALPALDVETLRKAIRHLLAEQDASIVGDKPRLHEDWAEAIAAEYARLRDSKP